MDYMARHRFADMGPRKIRQFAAMIRGMAADEALETIEERGEMDLDQRTRLRLASTWAIQSSREIVNTLFHDCG